MSGDALHPLTVEVTRLREQLVRSDAALRQARAELADLRAALAAPLSAPADMLAELVA